MSDAANVHRSPLRNGSARTAVFLAVWLILFGPHLSSLLAGAPAAVIAAWTSLRLLPAGQGRFRPVALAHFALRFLRQSLSAGIDVARRAVDPRMPLRPGFIVYQSHLSPGPIRDAFCTITSLLPGTLPSGVDDEGRLIVHCLDVTQPVMEQLATEEALLVHALGRTQNDG